jgi:PAS domain S-box-containing protein
MTDNATLSAQIVGATPDAVIFADHEGIIRLWNAGAERIFGYTAAEALGQNLDIIVPEKQRSRHWDGYNDTMRTGETKYGAGDLLAVPALRKDGSRISIEFSIALLRSEDGSVAGAAAILRDVSKRSEQERELRRRLAELEPQSS